MSCVAECLNSVFMVCHVKNQMSRLLLTLDVVNRIEMTSLTVRVL